MFQVNILTSIIYQGIDSCYTVNYDSKIIKISLIEHDTANKSFY